MLVRRAARPLLASIFIAGGVDAARNPAGKVPSAEKLLGGWTPPGVADTEQLVRLDGIAKAGAGLALALGRAPRLASVVLAASLVPTTLAGHRFWEETDPAARKAQRLNLLKNAAILGGVILAAVDTEGRPSVGWRARHAIADSAQALAGSAHDLADSAPVSKVADLIHR
jgi:putative oxidoreductase